MKPGKNDIKTNVLIQGDELDALQNISWVFTECFGLDSRISKYKGKRPIGLYQWDFECLISGIDYIVNNKKGSQGVSQEDLRLLGILLNKIDTLCKNVYD